MVSIIIPTYQRPKKLYEAIQSVKKQTFKDVEIIVVDDNGIGSSFQKETNNLVAALNDRRIKYIAHKENRGGCAARNSGIKNANGEFVAFLDDDDVWSDTFLEKLLKEFKKDIGAVYCDYWSYNGYFSMAQKTAAYYEGSIFLKLLEGWCPASTSFFIIRKKDIIEAGLFDEELKSFQDYDMWLRLSKITHFAFCNERLVIKYEGIGEQTSKNPKKRMDGYKRLIEKHSLYLNKEEELIFEKAKEKYYFSTLFSTILYNKEHGISFHKEKKEYLAKYPKKRLSLFFHLHFPKKIKRLLLRTFRNKNLIICKGLPNL